MKIDIMSFIKRIPGLLKQGYLSIFPRKGKNENVIQYILRQFYISDSRGNPSLTVTILVFVMAIVAAVTFVECRMALMMTYVYDAAGRVIGSHPTGFSITFLSLVISMSAILTYFYRQRQNKVGSDESGEVYHKGTVDQIKNYIDSVVGTTKPPTPPEGK